MADTTIEYINERRLLNGLGPVSRHPILPKNKTADELKDYLNDIPTEKELNLTLLRICEEGTLEDMKRISEVAKMLYNKNLDFTQAVTYRALVSVCIEEKYIKSNEVIYEV